MRMAKTETADLTSFNL